MPPRIMYIEDKSNGLSGPGRIGRVRFSKSGKSLYYGGRTLQTQSGRGFKSNYFDVETSTEFWVSGCKKRGGDRLYGGIVEIDDDVREEYWITIRSAHLIGRDTVSIRYLPGGNPVSVPVIAPRLGLYRNECNDDRERRFLERLNARAEQGGWNADSWSHTSDHVLIAVSLTDSERGSVLRDLRADYFGSQLLLGDDETHQFVTPLDPSRKDVTLVAEGSPEELADVAADWFEREMSRPIVREEWVVPGEVRERWLLADDGRELVLRGKWGAAVRQALGPAAAHSRVA